MSSKVRCAVIGSGFAGSTLAESIQYVPDAELVVIAGGRKAPELAARFGVRASDDVDGVLDSDEVDAVFIASPNPFHRPQTVRAAQRGKHVLVEKPLALSVADGQAMIEACQKAGVVLMVGHHQRFRRNGVAAKLLLDRGVIGRVDMVAMNETEPDQTTWLNAPENGGYLFGGGSHAFDLLNYWIGRIRRVAALTGQYRGVPVENGSLVLLEFESGAHGSFQNSVIPNMLRPSGGGVLRFDAWITGETGVLSVDLYGEVRQSTASGWLVHTSFPTWEGHYAFMRMEAYAAQAREFIAAIRERRPPLHGPEQALHAVAVCEAAHRAAAEERWVRVEA